MTNQDQAERTQLPPEAEESYRWEITGAMDSVVQYCRNVVNEHSHRGFWTPTGDNPNHTDLIDQARQTILNKLRMVLNCAETIATEIEHDEQRHHDRHQRHREADE